MPATNSSRKSRDSRSGVMSIRSGAEPVTPGHGGDVWHRERRPHRSTRRSLSAVTADPGAAARHAGDVADLGHVVADGRRRRTPRTPRAAPRRPPSARTRRRCSGGRRRRTGSRCWWAGSGRGTARAGRPRGRGGCPRGCGRSGSTARRWRRPGRSRPPIVAGFIRVRTTIGITGCSRIDSLSTASSQASSPSRAAVAGAARAAPGRGRPRGAPTPARSRWSRGRRAAA